MQIKYDLHSIGALHWNRYAPTSPSVRRCRDSFRNGLSCLARKVSCAKNQGSWPESHNRLCARRA
ncbi:hypothetical protein L249_5574 [Ophiocordyceps polyrhachis-furcata BCC 54312]|uniref:Uncharacterized protein n=1 Tax=Ophiocordyceps polyrhachis-furcata BCC 54312 TaxID=1330021 RepID=A0A367LGS7_9HYPO|nr:hypothetical protein L249_5574 [Ophiocordyceps polyrhachis-furcata BCC 54312]